MNIGKIIDYLFVLIPWLLVVTMLLQFNLDMIVERKRKLKELKNEKTHVRY